MVTVVLLGLILLSPAGRGGSTAIVVVVVLTSACCCCFVVALSPRGGRHISTEKYRNGVMCVNFFLGYFLHKYIVCMSS